jgi:hypothetical protein
MGACNSTGKKHKHHRPKQKRNACGCYEAKKKEDSGCMGGCCECAAMNDPGMETNMGRILSLNTMGFDDTGNLRHGMDRRDRIGEMHSILAAERKRKKGETRWAIVDATWLYQWLLFVNSEEDDVPAPGPVHNHRLVMRDPDGDDNNNNNNNNGGGGGDGSSDKDKDKTERFVPRIGLVMEKSGKMGDYRKVSIAAWAVFKKLYPGSGPDIIATFPIIDTANGEVDQFAANGYYPTDSWEISGKTKKRRSSTLQMRFGIGRKASYAATDEMKQAQEAVLAKLADEGEGDETTALTAGATTTTDQSSDSSDGGGATGGRTASSDKKSVEMMAIDAGKKGAAATTTTSAPKPAPTTAAKQEATAKPPVPPAAVGDGSAHPVVDRRPDQFYDDIFNRDSEEEENL